MSKCHDKKCPSDKICNPSTGRCVKSLGKIGKSVQERYESNKDFMLSQTIEGLKQYIVSCDPEEKLKGWKSLKKADLVKFIIDNIDIETGKLLEKSKVIIGKKSQYFVGTDRMFEFNFYPIIYRDYYCKLEKNTVYMLRILAEFLNINSPYKLNKPKLIKEISKIIIFK